MSIKTNVMIILAVTLGSVVSMGAPVSVEKEWKNRNGKLYETDRGEDTCSEGKLVVETDSEGGMIRLGPAIQFQYNPARIAQSTRIEIGEDTGCRKRRETTVTAKEVQMRTDIDLCKSNRDNFSAQESLSIGSDGRLTYTLIRNVDGKTERSVCVFKEVPKDAAVETPERASAAEKMK